MEKVFYLDPKYYLDGFEVVKASNLKEAVVEALTSLGGSGSISEVRKYINSKYSSKWKLNTVGTIMAYLCPESTSSLYPKKDRVLEKLEHSTLKSQQPVFRTCRKIVWAQTSKY